MYGVLPYYLTKMLVDLPCQIILPILYTVITYWGMGLRNETESFFLFAAAILMVAIVGNSLGILLGSLFADFRVAIGIVPVTVYFTFR